MSASQYKPIYNSSWAVLIGINEYRDPGINNLRGPVSDAEELGKLLVSTYKFPADQVVSLTNGKATKTAILDEIENLTNGNEIDSDDRVLIFFSGHGGVRPGKRDSYYLVPYDASLGDWNSFISQESLLMKCRHIPAKHVLFILDACHSGSFVRAPKDVSPDLEALLTHGAWQGIGAGLPDQAAWDAGGGRNSLFTEYLLRGLKGEAARPDGVLTLSHLGVFVRDGVSQVHNEQVPLFGYLPDSEAGEFIFHYEPGDEIPNEIKKALLSGLTRVRVAAVWELEALSMSADPSLSYSSRAKLQEIAEDQNQDKMVRRAARVATKLSIPMLEALEKEWVDGPLFDKSDSSIFDRIIAGIEYSGHDNYYRNNDAMSMVTSIGLGEFDNVSEGTKRRFARAVIESAVSGAFKPRRFLRESDRIPDEWLGVIVGESVTYLMDRGHFFWESYHVQVIFNPLREWVEKTSQLPDRWVLFMEAMVMDLIPHWHIHNAQIKTDMLEILEAINSKKVRSWLRRKGKSPDLILNFQNLFQPDENETASDF